MAGSTRSLLFLFLGALVGCGSSLGEGQSGDGGADASGPLDGSASAADAGTDAAAARSDAAEDAPADAPGAVTYLAYSDATGAQQLVILKRDPQRKLCFDLRLRNAAMNTSAITVPQYWAFDSARVWNDDAACVKLYAGGAASFIATSESGSIAFPGVPSVPQTVDSVNVTLGFSGAPGWAPASEVVATAGLPVK